MKHVLVTGASGFVGRNVTEHLANFFHFEKVSRLTGFDLLDPDWYKDVDSDINTVLHLAATTFVPESFELCYDYYDFNIKATLNISEFCKKRKVKKLIYMNTYVYGNPDKLPIDENHRIKLPSPYHKSKQLAEDLAINYFEANETKVISLRVFNLFGEGQGENFLVQMLVRQSLYSNQFEVLDLEPKRDFFYIKDFTNLIKKIIEKRVVKSGIYNVGSGKSFSVGEVIKILKQITGRDIGITSKKVQRKREIMDCRADICKVSEAFNWQPIFSLKDALRDYIGEQGHV